MTHTKCKATLALLLLTGATMLAGCAGTPPKAEFVQKPKESFKVTSGDKTVVNLTPASGVEMAKYEKDRLSQVIEGEIDKMKSLNAGAASERDYDVEVLITRYEKGNAFARAMLMGLGQIHIDGDVTVYALPDKTKVSEFTVKKTFAWGGIYGGTTRIEDVEPAFADGIAMALTGREAEPAK